MTKVVYSGQLQLPSDRYCEANAFVIYCFFHIFERMVFHESYYQK
jgi:hypothetical protein